MHEANRQKETSSNRWLFNLDGKKFECGAWRRHLFHRSFVVDLFKSISSLVTPQNSQMSVLEFPRCCIWQTPCYTGCTEHTLSVLSCAAPKHKPTQQHDLGGMVCYCHKRWRDYCVYIVLLLQNDVYPFFLNLHLFIHGHYYGPILFLWIIFCFQAFRFDERSKDVSQSSVFPLFHVFLSPFCAFMNWFPFVNSIVMYLIYVFVCILLISYHHFNSKGFKGNSVSLLSIMNVN